MTLTSGGDLQLGTTSSTFGNKMTIVGGAGGDAYLTVGDGTRTGYIGSNGTEVNIGSYSNTPVTFNTNDTERARIDTSGNLLVGTTSSSQSANVGSKILPTGAFYAVGNSPDPFSYYNTGGSQYRFFVGPNGGISNFSANNVNLSDRKEKTNFAPAGNYLAKICAIPVQTYNYINQDMEEDGGLTLGVVAQDVQEVAPELVTESNWGTEEEPKMRLSIYQTDLQYALMKCIQEQQVIIESLKARLDAANL
jgi:hypothetical protein